MPDLNGNTPGEKKPPPPPPPPHTPSRPTNNYASINSPIMSAKRSKKRTTTNNTTTLSPMHNPKHVPKDSHVTTNNNEIIPSSNNNNEELLDTNNSGDNNGEGASWVGRKVDAIFSPVLSFLNGATTNSTDDELTTTTPYNNVELEDDNNDEKEDKVDDAKSEVLVNGNSNTNSGTEVSNTVDIDGDVTMVDHPKVGLGNGVADDNQPEEDIADEDKYDEVEVYDDDDDEDEFNPHLFIKCLPPYQYVLPPDWTTRPRALPPHDAEVLPPICLVLDLDETLVHCTVEPIDNADIIFPVNFNGTEYQVHVRYRPFLQEFLEAVSKTFEVVIFTASQQVYADQLLDRIDPGECHITTKWNTLLLYRVRFVSFFMFHVTYGR